jgi:hypothetical protein
MPPPWLVRLAVAWLAIGVGSAVASLTDMLISKPMLMPVMRWVWPINALYLGPVAIWAYWSMDRVTGEQVRRRMQQQAEKRGKAGREGGAGEGDAGSSGAMGERMHRTMLEMKRRQPFWRLTFKAVTHCGSGCTLGDFLAEWVVFFAAWEFAGRAIWPQYLGDYALAYLFGIAFQFSTIAPMRGLGVRDGILAAMKADTLSLTAFELGLFGWMALSAFLFHPSLHPDHVAFWFMMQVGMLVGFATAFPMNWWLLKKGLKEPM